MIFVTVGTTDFDELVAAADRLAVRGEDVLIQIGHGDVEPRRARWFRFAPALQSYYDQADLVITHGGLGTLTEVLRLNLPTVGVSNPDRFDHHQDQILQAFEEAGHLIWCRDLNSLEDAVQQARRTDFTAYTPSESQIHLWIRDYLHRLQDEP